MGGGGGGAQGQKLVFHVASCLLCIYNSICPLLDLKARLVIGLLQAMEYDQWRQGDVIEGDGSAVSAQSLLCLSPAPSDIMDGLLCICRHCTGPPRTIGFLLLLEHYVVRRGRQNGHE